jgi:hypothetical protein
MSESLVEIQTFSVEEHLDMLKRLPLNREGTEAMNSLWNGTLQDETDDPTDKDEPMTPEQEPEEQKN